MLFRISLNPLYFGATSLSDRPRREKWPGILGLTPSSVGALSACRLIKIVYLPFPECSSVYSNQIDRRIAMTGVEGSPMSQVNVPLCFGFCA
jgi:hypothetical protein